MKESIFEDDLDAVEEYRQRRLKELRKTIETKRVITFTDEYKLIQKTKKDKMIVHFYDESFNKCKVMDHNLNKICGQFKDIEFIRIDANIANVLTSKLEVTTLPFLAFFRDGFFVDHLVGFEGLGTDSFESESLVKLIKTSDIMKVIK